MSRLEKVQYTISSDRYTRAELLKMDRAVHRDMAEKTAYSTETAEEATRLFLGKIIERWSNICRDCAQVIKIKVHE